MISHHQPTIKQTDKDTSVQRQKMARDTATSMCYLSNPGNQLLTQANRLDQPTAYKSKTPIPCAPHRCFLSLFPKHAHTQQTLLRCYLASHHQVLNSFNNDPNSAL